MVRVWRNNERNIRMNNMDSGMMDGWWGGGMWMGGGIGLVVVILLIVVIVRLTRK